MNHSENLQEFAKALSAFQSKIENPEKTAKNPFLKNKYAPLADILKYVRPELAKHGLSITQLVGGEDKISVTTMLMHSSGQFINDTVTMCPGNSKGLSNAQDAGIIITYLRRYSLTAILGIEGDSDTDGHLEQKQEPKEPAKKPAPKNEPLYDTWRKNVSSQAKKVHCTKAEDFYKVINLKFPDLVFVGDVLDWTKLSVVNYNILMSFFTTQEWKSVLEEHEASLKDSLF